MTSLLFSIMSSVSSVIRFCFLTFVTLPITFFCTLVMCSFISSQQGFISFGFLPCFSDILHVILSFITSAILFLNLLFFGFTTSIFVLSCEVPNLNSHYNWVVIRSYISNRICLYRFYILFETFMQQNIKYLITNDIADDFQVYKRRR